ncbi:HAD family phosphatase [Candidatus Micrarchaeota archaeon]|nr:HAD family phosphatase [Candidatus Micrarchaeota archaeon]MBU1165503.1 HAD family phosphatase [Candidatus Micrarchaeota archaeon]MBU1886341.1 HAD family phosphatase [Candidatus Micrarchaeota archaeon]
MIKAIIFDMDGLIVDTEPLLAKTVIRALKNQDVTLTEMEYFEHWTKDGGNIKLYIQKRNIIFDFDRYRREKKEIYLSLLNQGIPFIQNAPEKIRELYKRYKLALVSSSNKDFVEKILISSNLKKYFSVVVSSEDVKKEKPDPEGFLLAAKKLKVSCKECVVLEDAEKGIVAAKAAGMKAIAIPNRYTKNNDFSKADQVLSSLKEVNL